MATTQTPPSQFVGAPPVLVQPAATNGATAAVKRRKPRHYGRWIFLALVVLLAGGGYYAATLPPIVHVATPKTIRITESIAVTGSVKGRKESIVGAQAAGTVENLYVREGDRVHKKQLIARIRNSAAEAAVAQARQAIDTARSQLEQAEMRPLSSDLAALRAKVRQAHDALAELAVRAKKATVAVSQAQSNVKQAQNQLESAIAGLTSAEAQLSLAQKKYDRASTLYDNGAVSKESLDEAETALTAANASAKAARTNVASADTNVSSARDAEEAARLDTQAIDSEIEQGKSAEAAAQQQYISLTQQPLNQNVAVFRARLRDAEAALRTARAQAQYAAVVAPYDGIVTAVLSELGSSPSATGVVKIAEMEVPQISANLDEVDMADLRLGQKAVVSSAADPSNHLEGKIIRIGPEVDFSRGTVEIRIRPEHAAAWLMPGQTVAVNVIKHENISRLAVPLSAIREEGNASAVFVVRDGVAVARPLKTGPAVGTMIPVLEGISATDQIIANPEKVQANGRVRIAR